MPSADSHRLDPDAAEQLIRDRRTIHSFRPDPIPDSLIETAIDLARWAPNHRHTEPWRFHLIGEQTRTRIVELNAELVEAKKGPEAAAAKRLRWSEVPGWLCVTCVESEDPIQRDEDYAACCCAIQNVALYLWSAGVGFKWTTGPVTRDRRLCSLLGFQPAEQRVVGLCWYGYPLLTPDQKRRDLGEVTSRHD